MAQYAIMRCSKLKTLGGVASSLQHNYRERETANADASLTADNQHLAAKTTDEAMGMLRERLPEKRRKDAVVAVEYLFTTSPEWAQKASESDQQAFFDKSIEWLEAKYGKENVIAATIQVDETTPHLSAFVVPLTKDGRLSAKEFIGNKTKMSDDQTTFAEKVADIGLERGVKGSKATHQTIRSYYARVNATEAPEVNPAKIREDLEPRVIKKSLLSKTVESSEMVAKRLTDKHIDPMLRAVVGLREELGAERKQREGLNRQLAGALKCPKNLEQDQAQQLLEMASTRIKEDARQARKEARENRDDRDFER